MKNVFFPLLIVTLFFAVGCGGGGQKKATTDTKVEAPNTLTEAEQAAGWVLLFNGKDLTGWRAYGKTGVPEAWSVVDGAITLESSGRGEAGAENGGDLLYDKKFKNFHLKFDWKIAEGGNSGVFFLGQEIDGWEIWKTAPEFQVLDNVKHIDAELGVDGNRKAASLYDLIPAKPQNSKPTGEWNSAEILCSKGTVVYKQNGEKVLEFHLWTEDWNKMVANSKFPELNPDWAKVAEEGYIVLQDHGDAVYYKNFKIREL